MLHCMAFVRTDVSEEYIASIVRVTRISELRTTLAVTSNRRTLQRIAHSISSQHALVASYCFLSNIIGTILECCVNCVV
jgi:hypothetical protein